MVGVAEAANRPACAVSFSRRLALSLSLSLSPIPPSFLPPGDLHRPRSVFCQRPSPYASNKQLPSNRVKFSARPGPHMSNRVKFSARAGPHMSNRVKFSARPGPHMSNYVKFFGRPGPLMSNRVKFFGRPGPLVSNRVKFFARPGPHMSNYVKFLGRPGPLRWVHVKFLPPRGPLSNFGGRCQILVGVSNFRRARGPYYPALVRSSADCRAEMREARRVRVCV